MLRKVLILFLALANCSCTYLFSSAYGFKNPKKLNHNQLATQAKRYNIPAENSFELDTAYFYTFLKTFPDSLQRKQVKNHYQPLQALYFDKSGNLQSFHINCFAGGFPNLNWNRNQSLRNFPPKTQAPLDTLVSWQLLNSYLKPQTTTLKPETTPDYTVVVFWSRTMGRQSKRLIGQIQQNCALAKNQKVRLVYVNNDYLLARLWQ